MKQKKYRPVEMRRFGMNLRGRDFDDSIRKSNCTNREVRSE